jgi:hypothetical protein
MAGRLDQRVLWALGLLASLGCSAASPKQDGSPLSTRLLERRYYALSTDLPYDPAQVVDVQNARVDGAPADVTIASNELHIARTDAVGRSVEVWATPAGGDALSGRLERCRGSACDHARVELRPLWSGTRRIRGYDLLSELDDDSWSAGRVLALAESDGLVALALGPVGFALVDATDPNALAVVSQVPALDVDEWINDVAILEHRWLLVASSTRGLRILDIADPTAPLPAVDAFPTARTNVHRLFLDGHRLYLSRVGPFGGLDIVDVRDPTRPRSLADLDVPGCDQVHATFARGDTLITSCLDQGLFVFDLSSSFELELVAHDDELGSHSACLLDDGTTLLATSERYEGALRVLRLDRDRKSLDLVTTVATHSAASVHDVSCRGLRCTVSHYQEGVFELDLSTPEAPKRTHQFPTWDQTAGVFLEGASDAVFAPPRVYVADTTRGLLLLERH